MNMKMEKIPVHNGQKRDMNFLIKAVNNILGKYKNMQVVDFDKVCNTNYITLEDDSFSAVIGYNKYTETLEIEIKNAVNLDFRNDLERELKEVLMFT